MCDLFTMLAGLCCGAKRVRHEVTFLQYLYVDHDHQNRQGAWASLQRLQYSYWLV